MLGKQAGAGRPDSASSAGNQRDLSGNPIHASILIGAEHVRRYRFVAASWAGISALICRSAID
jgi:hypothetical protein